MSTYPSKSSQPSNFQSSLSYQERVTDALSREAVIIEERLPVRLTDAEVLEVSRKAAELYRQCAFLELEKKEQASLFKSRIEVLEKEMAHLQNVIQSQQEWKTIQCEKTLHYDIGEVTITRLDTGHVIETRPMTREERQMSLEL